MNSGEAKKTSSTVECSICLEVICEKKRCELACKHTFHRVCVANWLQTNPSCPVCRSPANLPLLSPPPPAIIIPSSFSSMCKAFVESVGDSHSQAVQARRHQDAKNTIVAFMQEHKISYCELGNSTWARLVFRRVKSTLNREFIASALSQFQARNPQHPVSSEGFATFLLDEQTRQSRVKSELMIVRRKPIGPEFFLGASSQD